MRRATLIVLLGIAISLPASSATLLHWYTFQGNVNDLVGSENGQLENGATASGGRLILDGINDYVQFASHLVPSGSYSVRFEAQGPTAWNRYFEMISQGGSPGWYIGAEPRDGNIRLADGWGDGPFPTDGRMHLYALVVDADAGTSKFFIDGIWQNTAPFSIAAVATGTDTRLGRQYGILAEYFAGSISDLRIYSGALSDSEVGTPEPSAFLLAGACFCLLGIRRHFSKCPKRRR
jgi:hypothetical protein